MTQQQVVSIDKSWQANWQQEVEEAYLYRKLADLARTLEMKTSVAKMAEQEEEHTTVWAVIPILPFLFLPSSAAVWTAIVISMAGHFVVGAGRTAYLVAQPCAEALTCS